jgi:predicted helicase
LARLLKACTACTVINEQSHIDCGAPDLTLLRKGMAVAYIEAKDLEDGDLDGRKKNREQFDRYKASLDTIIFTDYLDFHLYERGEWVQSVRLAEIQGNKIRLSDPDRFLALMEHIRSAQVQRITSAGKLAQIMAGKARLLRDIIEQALLQDGDSPTELRGYMEAFRQVLIHDITPKTFADIYAQTIAYGMFAARLHDTTPEDFCRQEAASLIPKTNPFLRKVFQQIAGYDLDERIAWIVDDLVTAFAATDMERIMQGFGRNTQQTDPMLHFYEDFLFRYDPAAKKQCGVYYTPQPVVEFIVHAVDDILRTDFALPMGLADTTRANGHHRVQILDPATGTGTFLAETVRQIKRDLGPQMGAWDSYVPDHLLPRLHGFELMMAPYTIAHLKLDMEIGLPAQQRLRVYLTNSLEESNPDAGTLFGNYLAQEANEASTIKKSAPVMIVMGNPPYSGISQNNGEWITNLLADYKKEPGGVNPLQERKIWLNDDYCKFIRLGQYYVDRNKEGVLAYICNNGFLDNPTFRGMRWHLMQSFDKIFILNLHGNARKKELTIDGCKDENVFDIMTGVSINIFIKTGRKKKGTLADVYYYDLMGLRDEKYNFLRQNHFASIEYSKVNTVPPLYFFIPQDTEGEAEYKEGFSVDELMRINVTGVVSARDGLVIDQNRNELLKRIQHFVNLNFSDDEIRKTFFGKKKEGKYLPGDSRGWKLADARRKIQNNDHSDIIKKYEYRPLDFQFIYYTPDMVDWGREKFMCHFLRGENLGIVCKKGFPNNTPPIFVSDSISDFRYWSCSGMQGGDYVFPLYLYPEPGSLDPERRPNLDEAIWSQINAAVGHDTTPEDVFDYIYGVLHSPHYREKYREFLKVDFPRIPFPKNVDDFEHFRACGNALRELHLMHAVPESSVTFPNPGSMIVDYLRWEWNKDDGYSGTLWINDEQCFENIPADAWTFYIGGYQPAQKWLKDRKGRALSFDDIEHYRRIIAVLTETKRIMDTIDDPSLQVAELKHKVASLENQLKQKGKIVNYGTININDNSHNFHIK